MRKRRDKGLDKLLADLPKKDKDAPKQRKERKGQHCFLLWMKQKEWRSIKLKAKRYNLNYSEWIRFASLSHETTREKLEEVGLYRRAVKPWLIKDSPEWRERQRQKAEAVKKKKMDD